MLQLWKRMQWLEGGNGRCGPSYWFVVFMAAVHWVTWCAPTSKPQQEHQQQTTASSCFFFLVLKQLFYSGKLVMQKRRKDNILLVTWCSIMVQSTQHNKQSLASSGFEVSISCPYHLGVLLMTDDWWLMADRRQHDNTTTRQHVKSKKVLCSFSS